MMSINWPRVKWTGLSRYKIFIQNDIRRSFLILFCSGIVHRRALLDHVALPAQVRVDHTLRPGIRVWHGQKECGIGSNWGLHRCGRASDGLHDILSHTVYAYCSSVDGGPRGWPLRKTACRLAWDRYRQPHYWCHHFQRPCRVGRGFADELAQQDHSEHSAIRWSDVRTKALSFCSSRIILTRVRRNPCTDSHYI